MYQKPGRALFLTSGTSPTWTGRNEMFPYENVMSIHNQKMTQYQNERSRKQQKEMVKAGRPSALERRVGEIVESLRTFGQAFGQPGRLA